MTKSDNAYKTIGEVAKILNLINEKNGSLNTHTIRFWEKNFKNIKPKILAGRRRYYDENAIASLKKADGLVIGSELCKGITDSIKKRQNPVTKLNKMVCNLKRRISE